MLGIGDWVETPKGKRGAIQKWAVRIPMGLSGRPYKYTSRKKAVASGEPFIEIWIPEHGKEVWLANTLKKVSAPSLTEMKEGWMMTHELQIKDFKTSLGFVATCSCGKRIHRVTGCNGSGRQYGLGAANELFEKHLKEVFGSQKGIRELR